MSRRLLALGVLAVAFAWMTEAVVYGLLHDLDREVLGWFRSIWNPSLDLPMKMIAALGGIEVAALLTLATAYLIAREAPRSALWALAALPLAEVVEILEKLLVVHPAPPADQTHLDGYSITDPFARLLFGHRPNGFPSGHMVRVVIAFGLLGFVVYRLTPLGSRGRWRRVAAVAVPVVATLLVAFSRLYLVVHYPSDVVGGVLLGAVALIAATLWLDTHGAAPPTVLPPPPPPDQTGLN